METNWPTTCLAFPSRVGHDSLIEERERSTHLQRRLPPPLPIPCSLRPARAPPAAPFPPPPRPPLPPVPPPGAPRGAGGHSLRAYGARRCVLPPAGHRRVPRSRSTSRRPGVRACRVVRVSVCPRACLREPCGKSGVAGPGRAAGPRSAASEGSVRKCAASDASDASEARARLPQEALETTVLLHTIRSPCTGSPVRTDHAPPAPP